MTQTTAFIAGTPDMADKIRRHERQARRRVARPIAANPDPSQLSPQSRLAHVDPETLLPARNPARHPRTAGPGNDLAASLKELGMLQPILARAEGDRLRVVLGERRRRAAIQAGLAQVPVLVASPQIEDRLRRDGEFALSLADDLSLLPAPPLERARAFAQLRSAGWTLERIARAVGKPPDDIARSLEILQLPEAMLHRIDAGKLTVEQARVINALPEERHEPLCERAAEDQLTDDDLKAEFGDRSSERRRLQSARAHFRQRAQHLVDALNEVLERPCARLLPRRATPDGSILIACRGADEADQFARKLAGDPEPPLPPHHLAEREEPDPTPPEFLPRLEPDPAAAERAETIAGILADHSRAIEEREEAWRRHGERIQAELDKEQAAAAGEPPPSKRPRPREPRSIEELLFLKQKQEEAARPPDQPTTLADLYGPDRRAELEAELAEICRKIADLERSNDPGQAELEESRTKAIIIQSAIDFLAREERILAEDERDAVPLRRRPAGTAILRLPDPPSAGPADPALLPAAAASNPVALPRRPPDQDDRGAAAPQSQPRSPESSHSGSNPARPSRSDGSRAASASRAAEYAAKSQPSASANAIASAPVPAENAPDPAVNRSTTNRAAPVDAARSANSAASDTGSSGVIVTAVRTPASDSRRTASSRSAIGGQRGSNRRRTASSSVVTEKFTHKSPSANRRNRSMSRSASGLRVCTASRAPRSNSTSTIRRVSPK